jgi:hypothetical protein
MHRFVIAEMHLAFRTTLLLPSQPSAKNLFKTGAVEQLVSVILLNLQEFLFDVSTQRAMLAREICPESFNPIGFVFAWRILAADMTILQVERNPAFSESAPEEEQKFVLAGGEGWLVFRGAVPEEMTVCLYLRGDVLACESQRSTIEDAKLVGDEEKDLGR